MLLFTVDGDIDENENANSCCWFHVKTIDRYPQCDANNYKSMRTERKEICHCGCIYGNKTR
jgi:hypothetical protein